MLAQQQKLYRMFRRKCPQPLDRAERTTSNGIFSFWLTTSANRAA
jgi:hypothetical protein